MKCLICNSKIYFGYYCHSCNDLWNQNIDRLKSACYEAYNNNLSYENLYNYIDEFSFYFCKSNILTKIINDIKLSFNMPIKFEKKAIDYILTDIINKLLTEQSNINLFNVFKLIDFKRANYSPNIKINEYNFPDIKLKMTEVIAKLIDFYLKDEITSKYVFESLEYQNTYINTDYKKLLSKVIFDKIKNMASDYFFNAEEVQLIDKLYILYPEMKKHLNEVEWYRITTIITLLFDNLDDADFKEHFGLSNAFIIDTNERVLYCDKNILFYKMKHRTRIKSNGLGVSIKICSGVYLRPSSYTSTPVNEEYLDCIADGNLILTDQNLIIDGNNYSNKIPYKKILNIQVYSDGIDILFSNTEKPIFCKTKYSHVLYSLLLMIKNKQI